MEYKQICTAHALHIEMELVTMETTPGCSTSLNHSDIMTMAV
jgi:hypothetical protein